MFLSEGKRLSSPRALGYQCDEEAYRIMRSCWETLPQGRPSFQKLSVDIEEEEEEEAEAEAEEEAEVEAKEESYRGESAATTSSGATALSTLNAIATLVLLPALL
ncbi:hypothetical protein TcWFU_001777 [Taenia crassiceps]|uniref:Serine-threonine/tyrosine-protein kinase catalytic domain-containing protein n=1 Tax=Taenia crassiceps TaxID=6207 RepID=A0ABR4PZR7_9CEST